MVGAIMVIDATLYMILEKYKRLKMKAKSLTITYWTMASLPKRDFLFFSKSQKKKTSNKEMDLNQSLN